MYSNSSFSSVLRYNYNKLDLGIPEDGIAEQTSTKTPRFQDKGFNHLLSLNSVIYLKNSKLDVDLGYVDRSEFVDSDVAGLHMKLKTLITMRSTICLKWVHWNQLLEFKECIKLIRT
jgi:iron complex outermembrane receptor protein